MTWIKMFAEPWSECRARLMTGIKGKIRLVIERGILNYTAYKQDSILHVTNLNYISLFYRIAFLPSTCHPK